MSSRITAGILLAASLGGCAATTTGTQSGEAPSSYGEGLFREVLTSLPVHELTSFQGQEVRVDTRLYAFDANSLAPHEENAPVAATDEEFRIDAETVEELGYGLTDALNDERCFTLGPEPENLFEPQCGLEHLSLSLGIPRRLKDDEDTPRGVVVRVVGRTSTSHSVLDLRLRRGEDGWGIYEAIWVLNSRT